MSPWRVMIDVNNHAARVLVTDSQRNEILKALLPSYPSHPRALLTTLEGLALWSDSPLDAAICAAPSLPPSCGEALFGRGLFPLDSALVRFHEVEPARRRRHTLPGVGDFRQLRLMLGRSA